ncbi:uracil-DNA glycosylase [Chromatium okenii]|nr:uracil-DNA glycosylase [Chromatium okenii]
MFEDVTMDETRRRAYLEAMDISLWQPRFAASPTSSTPAVMPAAAPASAVIMEQSVESTVIHPAPAPIVEVIPPAPMIETAAPVIAAPDWNTLIARVSACRACGLCEQRTQTVFGSGKRDAALMFIGEAPGAEEDQTGEPFVGRAGKLLTAIVRAMGLEREQIYIANVVKCRPPDNRNPHPDEIAACAEYLREQVALIQPRMMLALGGVAGQSLLHTTETVGALRGRWFTFGETKIPLRVTYHPAYLLRSPNQKVKVWNDLVAVLERMNVQS